MHWTLLLRCSNQHAGRLMTCQKKSASSSMSLLFSSGLKHWHHLWHAFVTCFMPSPGNLGACCNSLRMHCSGAPSSPVNSRSGSAVTYLSIYLVRYAHHIAIAVMAAQSMLRQARSGTCHHIQPVSGTEHKCSQPFVCNWISCHADQHSKARCPTSPRQRF